MVAWAGDMQDSLGGRAPTLQTSHRSFLHRSGPSGREQVYMRCSFVESKAAARKNTCRVHHLYPPFLFSFTCIVSSMKNTSMSKTLLPWCPTYQQLRWFGAAVALLPIACLAPASLVRLSLSDLEAPGLNIERLFS
jgi:hypothetical protein